MSPTVSTTDWLMNNFSNQTEDEPPSSHPRPQIVTVIFILIGIVGSLGNAVVCVVIGSTLARSKRSGTTNLLILHQAVVDTMTSLILIMIYTIPYPYVPRSGGWGEFLCRMWVPNTLLWMLFVVSTFNLCMMSLERYAAVAYPVLYATRFRRPTTAAMITFCWTVAPLLHYFYPIAYDYNDGGVCGKRGDPTVVAAIGVMLFVWEFFIPFLIMTAVYMRIVYLLRQQQRRVRREITNVRHQQSERATAKASAHAETSNHGTTNQIGPTGRGQMDASVSLPHPQSQPQPQPPPPPPPPPQQQQQQARAPSETVRRNVTVTLLSVFIMYVICWMPNHLTFLQFGLGGPLNLSGAWYYVTLILSYLNMSINPFIYALKYKPFKEGLRRLLCGRCCGQYGVSRAVGDETLVGARSLATVTGSA